MFARRAFTIAFTIFLAERFYNVFTNTLIPGSYTMFPHSLFILFYNVHTRQDGGSGITFLYIFAMNSYSFLKSICQQLGLPLLFVTAAGKFFDSFGEGRVTRVTFIVSHQGRI